MRIELSKYIYDKMTNHQFVMSVMGDFNQDFLKSLMKMTESKLDSLETEGLIKKRIFHFMVECAQNLCKMNNEQNYRENSLFLLGRKDGDYVLYIGSIFSAEQAGRIKNVIDDVNKLNGSEVKKHFYTELTDLSHGGQNHLLLSLLDVSKRTRNKISYEITPVDASKKFFSFKTSIPGKIQ